MEVSIFATKDGQTTSEQFETWLKDHPDGFYINHQTDTMGMLHRVGCKHVGKPSDWKAGSADLTRNPKICHTDRNILDRWAKEQGIVVTVCSDCVL